MERTIGVFCSLISVWFDDLLSWLFLLSVIFGILTDVVLSYGTVGNSRRSSMTGQGPFDPTDCRRVCVEVEFS